METAYINHKSDVDFPKETALYLAQHQLAGMHYQDAPVTTSTNEYSGSGSGTFDSFCDYATEPHVIGVRNNAHPMLKGGMMVGSVVPPDGVSSSHESPMGIVVTLSDRDSIDDVDRERYDRIRQNTSGFGPDEYDSVIADIPLPPGLTGDEIISRIQSTVETAPEVANFLHQLHSISEHDRTFTAFDETFEVSKSGNLDCVTVLQVIRLDPEYTKWVWYRDYPLFASINHRGTTNGWNTGSEQLLAAYTHAENRFSILNEGLQASHGLTDIDPIESKDLLSADELETLCSEYLRQGLFENEGSVDVEPYDRYTHISSWWEPSICRHCSRRLGNRANNSFTGHVRICCRRQSERSRKCSWRSRCRKEKYRRMVLWGERCCRRIWCRLRYCHSDRDPNCD